MKIDVHLGVAPLLQPAWGGLYSYSDSMVRAIFEYSRSATDLQFTLFTDHFDVYPLYRSVPDCGWKHYPFTPPSSRRQFLNRARAAIGEGPHRELWRKLRRQAQRRSAPQVVDPDRPQFSLQQHQWLRSFGIDLMLYGTWGSMTFEAKVPYVTPIYDLLHRTEAERFMADFGEEGPEHCARREYSIRNAVRFATLIIADSPTGKENILAAYSEYGVKEDRIKVLPFIPASFLSSEVSAVALRQVREQYSLPAEYFFYPAQLWPHKNHRGIIEALAHLKREKDFFADVVFSGANSGEQRRRHETELLALADSLGVRNQLHFLGHVPDQQMSALYAGALALVMPTFFGPTNIPPLEAWYFGCPVITSRYGGIDREMGDAAYLVDPKDSTTIAEAMFQIAMDETLRTTLIERGNARLRSYSKRDYQLILSQIIEEATHRVRLGDTPSFDL